MEIGYLQEVKAIIKSIVLSCPTASTIDSLNRDYRGIEGSPIPYKNLGFQTLEAFLRSIPDTVILYGSGLTATVHIVLNEKSDHIHRMVCQQKQKRTKSKGKPGRYRPPQNDFESHHKARVSTRRQQPEAVRNTVDNIPTCNIRFSHSIVRSSPRNTVIRCQALELPASFTADNIVKPSMRSLNRIHPKSMQEPSATSKSANNQLIIHRRTIHADKSHTTSPIKPTVDCEKLLERFKIDDDPQQTNIKIQTQQQMKNSFNHKIPDIVSDKIQQENGGLKSSLNMSQDNNSTEEKKRADEMEEAVPTFAANNLVFQMDFPYNTMTFGKKIAPYKLPINVGHGSIIGIFVSEIHNPYKFWFHIYKEHHELDKLMLHIERFYTSLEPREFCIPRVCICPGQICAALYNGFWHRAEILSPVIQNKAKVLFVDYGTVSHVPIDNVKFLLTMFATLPKQAIRGSLSHVRPTNLHWCQDATNYFLSLACDLMLYGQIAEIDELNRTIYLVLCDTNGSEVLQLNRLLVEKGFAYYDEEWQKSDKGEQRLRHLREDFPTFSMLEMGEYPSYGELRDLQNKGIDYEEIIDQTLYHPGRLDLQENVPDDIRKLPFKLLTTNPFRLEILLQLQKLI